MHENPVSRRQLFFSVLIAVVFNLAPAPATSSKSFVVFCDVGQGDASYIHIEPNIDVLIDAGKDASVIDCIHNANPSFDNIFEAIFISHAHHDHIGGLIPLLNNAQINAIILNKTQSSSLEVDKLLKLIKLERVPIYGAISGDSFNIGELRFETLWPTVELIRKFRASDDQNRISQVIKFTYNNHSVLYTGDVFADEWLTSHTLDSLNSDILKVPHHGSKRGLNQKLILLADPTYAVISVGRNNSYGHPSSKTLKLLQNSKAIVLRTDIMGDVIFSVDQAGYSVSR